ncbi:MAG: efflux transporter periplasmic adaptor subunit, partial [Gammaproteobacteria bacterium]|nr:efflux transporter periplasmic adaptor subunit [Gammaproteobacteria bacterium]
APANAVRRDAFGAKVFVLREAEEGAPAPERAEQRMVSLGPQRGGLVVIARGLRPGERVVADGAFKLRDGALVNAGSWDANRAQGVAGGG